MLAKFSVKRPMTILVAIVMVFILGFISVTGMTTDLLPSMELPYVLVMTTYPGASPERVELSVTRPLEQALASTTGMESVQSISQENVSIIFLEFSQNTNMDSVMIEMSNSIDQIKGSLDDSVSSPILMKISPDMIPVMVSSVDYDGMELAELSTYVSDVLLPEFERLDGVASVEATGLLEEQVHIVLNQDKIDDLNARVLASVSEELAESLQDLEDAQQEINDAWEELLEGEEDSDEMWEDLIKSRRETLNAQKQLNAAGGMIEMQKQQTLELLLAATEKLDKESADTLAALDQAAVEKKAAWDNDPENEELKEAYQEAEEARSNALNNVLTELNEMLMPVGISIDAKTTSGAYAQLESAKMSVLKNELSYEDNVASLKTALSSINSGIEQIESGWESIEDAKEKLLDSQEQLDEAYETFHDAREEALFNANLNGVITPATISQILTAENFSMPTGSISEDGVEYTVKVGEKYSSVEELEHSVLFNIDIDTIGEVRLIDVADIVMADNSEESFVRVNGNPGIVLSFTKQSTASTAELSDLINEKSEELMGKNNGLHLTALMDQGVYIDFVVDSVVSNLLQGAVLAIIVLIVFLKSVRPTIVVAFSIPISLLVAIVLMYFSNVTLNMISLSGLALGVGMLVDNSIVVIENIYRMRSEGVPAAKAAVLGAKEVSGSIVASTLTTICVFLPIVFTQGISRQIFTDMGLTIAYSLVASLVVALTLVPAMAATLLKKEEEKKHPLFDRMTEAYGKSLAWVLRHKVIVLGATLALLVYCVISVFGMGTSFMPDMQSPQMSATLTMPEDSTRDETRAVAMQASELIADVEGVGTVGMMEGGSLLTSTGSGNSITMYLLLDDDNERSNDAIAADISVIAAGLPCEISVSTSTMDLSALGGSGIVMNIEGNDLDTLRTVALEMENMLSGIEGISEVDDGLGEQALELRVTVDKNKAMKYGLTVAQVYSTIADAITDERDSTTLEFGVNEYPVVLVMSESKKLTASTLGDYQLTVTEDDKSKYISLSEIASIEMVEGMSSISRINQTRYVSVTATVDSAYNTGLVSREVETLLKDYELPAGIAIELAGENETVMEAMEDMLLMIVVAIAFIYLIMVAQFQSLLDPFIILFTLPLAFTGGLLALLLTGQDLSIVAMLGFLVLCGVVVNNGIVFLDYVNLMRLGGMERREALIHTGKTRMRPILMTALTTILAMSTMALGMGQGAEMMQPMALVTIGGLTYATFMTLYIVPLLYDVVHKKPVKNIDAELEMLE